MAILNFNVQPAGQSNLLPQKITVQSDSSSGQVAEAGFLNPIVAQGFPIYNGDFAFVSYSGGSAVYTASVSSAGVVTLTEYGTGSGGTVTYTAPSVVGNVAAWSNTTGNLVNGGALGAAAGKAVSNGALSTLASTAGSGFTVGHLISAGDVAGSVADSGVVAAAVQLSANIKAGTSGNIFNTGNATSLAVTVAGLTAASVVVAQIKSSDIAGGTGAIVATTPGTGSFTVTTNAIPVASLIIDYVAFIAAQ